MGSQYQLTHSYAVVKENCIGGLVIQVFDDMDKVGADVVLLHDRLSKAFLRSIRLKMCLTKESQVEDLLCGAPSSS